MRLFEFIKYRKWRGLVKIGRNAVIEESQFEGSNSVAAGSQVFSCEMGYASYCASNCFLRNAKIGRFCSIGKNVRIVDVTHPARNYVSTHPAFYSVNNVTGCSYVSQNIFEEKMTVPGSKWSVEIGHDVWICDNVLILGGVKIGNGAIIAAGAVVTKDIPPYAVCAGVPSKVLRYRFNREQIDILQNVAWWDERDKWLKINAHYFMSIDKFIEQCKNADKKEK